MGEPVSNGQPKEEIVRRNLTLILVAAAAMVAALALPQTTGAQTEPAAPVETTTTLTSEVIVVDGVTYTKAQIDAWIAAVEKARIDEMWRNIVALEQYRIDEMWRRIVEFDRAYKAWLLWSNIAKLDAWYKAQQAAMAPAPGPGGLIMGRKTCGGDLPPCYVMLRESKGYINIWNGGCSYPCGVSSASGKWQFIRGTWNGYGGYRNAADAPESVQDSKARQLWAGGRGCGHWGAC